MLHNYDLLRLLYFDQYTLDVSQFEKKSGARWLSPEHRYVWELINPEDSERVNQERHKLNAELHQRIVLPLYAVALVFIALAGVMSGEFTRRGRSRRMTISAIAGVLLLIGAMALFRASAQPALVIRQRAAIKPRAISDLRDTSGLRCVNKKTWRFNYWVARQRGTVTRNCAGHDPGSMPQSQMRRVRPVGGG